MGRQLNLNALLTAEVMPGQKEGDELDQSIAVNPFWE